MLFSALSVEVEWDIEIENRYQQMYRYERRYEEHVIWYIIFKYTSTDV